MRLMRLLLRSLTLSILKNLWHECNGREEKRSYTNETIKNDQSLVVKTQRHMSELVEQKGQKAQFRLDSGVVSPLNSDQDSPRSNNAVDDDDPTIDQSKDNFPLDEDQEKKLEEIFKGRPSEAMGSSDVKNDSLMVVGSEMTEAERAAELKNCEEIIGRAINSTLEAGEALSRIRWNKLYLEKYTTFEAYVKEELGLTRQRAHQLIKGAELYNTLSRRVDVKLLPTSERAMRELLRITDEKCIDVLRIAAKKGEPTMQTIIEAKVEVLGPAKEKKMQNDKVRKKRSVKTESGLKAVTSWVKYLGECDINALTDEDRTSLMKAHQKAIEAFKKLNLAA